MATAFLKLWDGKVYKKAVKLFNTIKNNFDELHTVPCNEDLAILQQLLVNYIQECSPQLKDDCREEDEIVEEGLVSQSEGHRQKNEDFLSEICKFAFHLLAHKTDDVNLQFRALFQNVTICANASEKCLKLVMNFCIRKISHYSKNIKDGVFVNDAQEFNDTEMKNILVPISSTLQLLYTVIKEQFPNRPYNSVAEFDRIFGELLELISGEVDDAVLALASKIITLFLKHGGDKEKLWNRILHPGNKQHENGAAYGVACLMIDEFLCGNSHDIRHKRDLRNFIQNGLISNNMLTRKRSMYILKRIVDSSSNRDFQKNSFVQSWLNLDSFILLFETLEEKQLHVMRPILPTIADVIDLSLNPKEGCEPLHFTWLTTTLTRALNHDSKCVTRWAVDTSLQLKVEKLQIFGEENWNYICGPLFTALKEIYLYEKEVGADVNQTPNIGKQLKEFFLNCQIAAAKENQEKPFFRKVLNSLCTKGFNAISFPYIAEALTCIEISGVADASLLSTIKSWMLTGTSQFPVEIKAAVYNLMLTISLNCLDKEHVLFSDFIRYVKVIFDKGYLSYGSPEWMTLADNVLTGVYSWCCNLNAGYSVDDANFCHIATSIMNVFLNGSGKSVDSIEEMVLILFLSFHETKSDSPEVAQQRIVRILEPLTVKLDKIGRNPYVKTEEVISATSLTEMLVRKCVEAISINDTNEGVVSRTKIVLNLLIQHLKGSLVFFRSALDSSLSDEKYDMFLALSCFKLQSSLCENAVHTFLANSRNFQSIFCQLELLCELCCRQSNNRKEHKNFNGVNLMFQVMKMLCDVISEENLSLEETKMLANMDVLLTQAIMQINLNFKSLLPNDYFQDKKDVRERNVETMLLLEIGDFTFALWSMILYAIKKPEVRTKIATKSSSDDEETFKGPSTLTLGTCDIKSIVEVIMFTIDVSVGKNIVPLLECIGILMPEISASCFDLTLLVLKATWRILMEQERRDGTFWKIYDPAINILFHKSLLLCNNQDIVKNLKSYWRQLQDLGRTKFGMMNLVMRHCCDVWRRCLVNCENNSFGEKENNLAVKSIFWFVDLLVDCCLFGHVQKKGLRIQQQAIEYFVAKFPLRDGLSNNINIDYDVRWNVMKLLMLLEPQDAYVVTKVMKGLISKDHALSKEHSRYYDNSHTHRQKLRIWQLMLVLLKFINEENANEILRDTLNVMLNENQPSIRYYNEWFVILLIHRFPDLTKIIFERLQEAAEKRVCSITSLMSILMHLIVLLPDAAFSEMAPEAFRKLLPWVQIHHMQARVHAQIALWKLWEEVKRRNLERLLKEFWIIESLFTLNETNASVFRSTRELRNHFYFKTFHPIMHYTLETIFISMPKLLSIGDDEILRAEQFLHLLTDGDGLEGMKIFDRNPCLLQEVRSIVVSANYDDATNGAEKVVVREGPVDVQKKITAWKPLPPTEDPFLQKAELYKKEMKRSELILCASLIDRMPNLGGLCRTCEIFGVSTFVIGAMRYLEDSNFKSLSVTAEKWINIEQILPRRLKGYLREMKSKGYRLVGIEQTANSKPLQEYKFQEKTLLLLGNEKEGIPVNLIQLLDDCVEIPQQGVIRSLNVHVSGAIIIWEYCKQRLLHS